MSTQTTLDTNEVGARFEEVLRRRARATDKWQELTAALDELVTYLDDRPFGRKNNVTADFTEQATFLLRSMQGESGTEIAPMEILDGIVELKEQFVTP